MFDKEKDLIDALARRQIGRREFMRRAGQLGIGAAALSGLMGQAMNRALAQNGDYDWKQHQGTTLKLLLNKHPYADAMIANLDSFKELTGMDVTYDVFPEDVYFDKVTAALSSGSSEYDALMTGAYMTWTYGPAGWIEDLNSYINDPSKTAASWDWEDFLPGLRASTAWDGMPGSELGSGDAKQWCLPWGFEQNNISYNRPMFEKAGVEAPADMPALMAACEKLKGANGDVYPIGVRGSRSWATIHPGFLSGYANFGEKDLINDGGMLKAAMNTDGSKAFHRDWVKMIQEFGPKNWSTYTWYQVGTDLGAGASAMIYDADILGYFMNGGDNAEAGNIAYAAIAPNPEASAPTPNVWIWSLAMSSFSNNKDAAWTFMQWASSKEHALFGARTMDFVNPVRASVWKDQQFLDRIDAKYPGYIEQFETSAPGAKIYFTPQPLFFDVTTAWAAMLQRMVANEIGVDEGLDQLAESINDQLSQAGLQ
ncbi:ABC transporter substrate-binding protein [Jiella marina]|uniref:ABC transporter substrate-binding protein n=1 Tax=Jiella sp. LLJ827 TaxID=2917712 RepID=UPI0021006B6B|nr:extracellular solute-binding protein [Jiella sp. LLJ827]MCQ0987895.1 extracellular solute-binding protein [Jiella sp. LLJ827]